MKGQAEIYIESQLDFFIRNFELSGGPDSENFIHDYRIAAKRIQTVLRLIEKLHPGNNLTKHKGYSAIRKAFTLGGELREIAVNLDLLEQSETKLKYKFRSMRNFIAGNLKRAGREHKKFLKKFTRDSFADLQKKIPEYFKNITSGEIISASDQFMGSCISEIRDLIHNKELNKNLHEARKVIKNIKYIFELRGLKDGSPLANNLTLLSITELEDHIGKWHDWQVFGECLGAFLRKKKNKQGIQILKFGALLSLADKILLSIQKEVCALIELQFTRNLK